jgi:hypothetical protein
MTFSLRSKSLGSILLSLAVGALAMPNESEIGVAEGHSGTDPQVAKEIERPMTWGRAFDKHAPLAFFSVGSLLVGGILMGIRAENSARLNPHSAGPDRDVVWGLSMAGLSSLAAGGAFWYYSHAEMTRDLPATPNGFSFYPTLGGEKGWAAAVHLSFSPLGG